MRTFKLPNGKTFEDYHPHHVMPVLIGQLDYELFDPENPIPQEYLEHVKEEYQNTPIYHRKLSIYDEEKRQLKFVVYYYITAVSDDFPKYRPLSFLDWERDSHSKPIERIVELTFQCEESKAVIYQKHKVANINLFDLIDVCLEGFHQEQLAGPEQEEDDGFYDLLMYDEAGWESNISIDCLEQLRDYLVSVRFVEEVE